jgi:hypothetical protein
MRPFSSFATAGVLAAGVLFASGSASAMSCSNRLVTVGDSATYVRSICGEPTAVSVRTESRTDFASAPWGRGVVGSAYTVTVQIETWVYDFGRRRFMEELTIESGIVRSIRALGYGTVSGGRRASIEGVSIDDARAAIAGRRRLEQRRLASPTLCPRATSAADGSSLCARRSSGHPARHREFGRVCGGR